MLYRLGQYLHSGLLTLHVSYGRLQRLILVRIRDQEMEMEIAKSALTSEMTRGLRVDKQRVSSKGHI